MNLNLYCVKKYNRKNYRKSSSTLVEILYNVALIVARDRKVCVTAYNVLGGNAY